MKPFIVFDVNETLLDLEALDPHFKACFGNSAMWKEWFSQVLLSAFSSTVIGQYHHFGYVARTALLMVASKYDIELPEESIDSILQQLRKLPPHPDVLTSMERLKEHGFRLAALTNSPYDVAHDQIEHAGITPFLEVILSVDASRTLKPARLIYEDASSALDVPPEEICLVAAHPWDIAGAMEVGWQGAFIQREGKVWNPLYKRPTYQAVDLLELVQQFTNGQLSG